MHSSHLPRLHLPKGSSWDFFSATEAEQTVLSSLAFAGLPTSVVTKIHFPTPKGHRQPGLLAGTFCNIDLDASKWAMDLLIGNTQPSLPTFQHRIGEPTQGNPLILPYFGACNLPNEELLRHTVLIRCSEFPAATAARWAPTTLCSW